MCAVRNQRLSVVPFCCLLALVLVSQLQSATRRVTGVAAAECLDVWGSLKVTSGRHTRRGSRVRCSGHQPVTNPLLLLLLRCLQVTICDVRVRACAAPLPDASWTQKGWCPRSSWFWTVIFYVSEWRIAVGGDSFACMPSLACRGRVRLLTCLLCMLGAVFILHMLAFNATAEHRYPACAAAVTYGGRQQQQHLCCSFVCLQCSLCVCSGSYRGLR
jgi:hypothetical protein